MGNIFGFLKNIKHKHRMSHLHKSVPLPRHKLRKGNSIDHQAEDYKKEVFEEPETDEVVHEPPLMEGGSSEDLHKEVAMNIKDDRSAALKKLEDEWHDYQKELRALETMLSEKEADVSRFLEKLKNFVTEADTKGVVVDKEVESPKKDLNEENFFYLGDGNVIKSISELKAILKNIRNYLYDSHVTSEKNDFADWVELVFGEHELASKMRSSKSKTDLLNILGDFPD